MKNKFIKISLIVVFLLSLSFFSLKQIENIKADSGWDSSYDSGGSWDSGSDFGGSSWDNDYDYDYDNDYSGGSGRHDIDIGAVVFGLMITGIIVITTFSFVLSTSKIIHNKSNINKDYTKKYERLTKEKANEIIPNFDIEEFNFKAYQIFYDVQMAWMEFDYDKLRDLVTDELYNSYVMQLETLKIKNHKNIMRGFELLDIYIYDLKEVNGLFVANVILDVKFYDYVENSKSGIILRGTPSRKLHNTYKLTFIKTKEETRNINECPRCGAPVEGNSTGICEYCKSKLINDNYNWIMSKKEKISQR